MAGASRRGYGADGIYVDHRGCCPGRRPSQDLFWALARSGLAGFRRGREADPRGQAVQAGAAPGDALLAGVIVPLGTRTGEEAVMGYRLQMSAGIYDWLAELRSSDPPAA